MVILFLVIEPIKRIISALLYPLAYVLRRHIRTNKVFVKEYLYHWRNGWFFLWIWLDDSIEMENMYYYFFSFDWCFNKSKYPKWLWKFSQWLIDSNLSYRTKLNDFIMSYWWSAIRNSCVNWNNYSAWRLGKFVKIICSYGAESFEKIKQDKKGYRIELRRYYNGDRIYLEFYLFKKWYQFGWIYNGRFEIDLWKNK